MIAKISTGSYTLGMVKYNHDKTNKLNNGEKEAVILGINHIFSNDIQNIVSTIGEFNGRNTNISKPNIHISLNFHKEDILSNDKIYEIAKDYMNEMGYDEQPYAVYRHFDKEHPHVHIVSSQVNPEGKKINDSHIYYRSQALTRKLEEKYGVTKAVEKNEIFDKKDIHKAIHEHLELGKHSLTAIMKRVLSEVMEHKPTNELQFERLLENYQMKRIISYDIEQNIKGHFFDLYPLEYLNEEKYLVKKSQGIEGNKLDVNFAFESIKNQIEQNHNEKNVLKNQVMGRVYSIINPITTNKNNILNNENLSYTKSSEFTIDLKKKGIELLIKRSQTGDDPNSIYALLFKDIKSGHTYTATELKLKTKEFLKGIDDDMKNLSNKEIATIYYKSNETPDENRSPFNKEPLDNSEKIINAFEDFKRSLENSTGTIEDAVDLNKKKRKRRRRWD